VPNFGALAAGAAAPGGAHGAGSANPNPNPDPNADPNPDPNPDPDPDPSPNPTAAEDEAAAFAGFDGFEADPEVTMEYDERSGWSNHRPHGGAATRPSVGGASAAQHSAGATASPEP
jgi:hypothetical protein